MSTNPAVVFKCSSRALFLVAAVTIFGQTTTTSKTPKPLAGPLHAEIVGNVMVVHSQPDKWRIDLATLPFLKSDCSPEAEASNRSITPDLIGCGYSPTLVGSMLSPPRVFFTLAVGTYAQNVLHVLFEADVARRSIRGLTAADSSIGNVVVSPFGRYVAYSVGWSSGVCHQTSSVFVADLDALRKATGPAAVAEVDTAYPWMLAEPIRWATGGSLVYRESKFDGDDSCKRHPWQTKTAHIRSLRFQ
jgi:pimeloyl-ACP methyl ester carboxylesterase